MLEKLLAKKKHSKLEKAAAIQHSPIPEIKTITNEALEALADLGYSVKRMLATDQGHRISIVTDKPHIIIDIFPGFKSGTIVIGREHTEQERKKFQKIVYDQSLSEEEKENRLLQNELHYFLSTNDEDQILTKLAEYGFKITKKDTNEYRHRFYFDFTAPREVLSGMTVDKEEKPDERKEKLAHDEKVSKVIEHLRSIMKRKGIL